MGTETKVSSVKEQVEHILRQLPDDCTLEDIQYHLYILQKLQNRARAADEATDWIPHEEVKKRVAQWLTK